MKIICLMQNQINTMLQMLKLVYIEYIVVHVAQTNYKSLKIQDTTAFHFMSLQHS